MAKPRKVEERATPYVASPVKKSGRRAASVSKDSTPSTVRHPDNATFQKAAAKVFKTHSELFRKLAQ
ncbi:MAG TPA: hypothetical protein VHO24_06660 [Opitutaceae bacterium]|nr:hypothetical protein [Opitutaceae bacterium]